MLRNDAFALKNSGLNDFLFAEVGVELNGSPLTILSILARLGKDPWAQAAEWAHAPNITRVEDLTRSISLMPLCPRALADAHDTASRLALLLPRQLHVGSSETKGHTASIVIPEWLPIALFCAILGLATMVGAFVTAPTVPPTSAQSVGPHQD